MNRILKISKCLKWLAFVCMIGTPVLTVTFWLTNGSEATSWLNGRPFPDFGTKMSIPEVSELTLGQKGWAILASLVPAGLASIAFYWLYRLFEHYSRQQFFSSRSVRKIRNFGLTVLIAQIIYPFYTALISLILSIYNSPGERFISVSIGFTQLKFVAFSLAVFVIAWIMEEARKLDEEVQGTV